jgi:hypothetical protein
MDDPYNDFEHGSGLFEELTEGHPGEARQFDSATSGPSSYLFEKVVGGIAFVGIVFLFFGLELEFELRVIVAGCWIALVYGLAYGLRALLFKDSRQPVAATRRPAEPSSNIRDLQIRVVDNQEQVLAEGKNADLVIEEALPKAADIIGDLMIDVAVSLPNSEANLVYSNGKLSLDNPDDQVPFRKIWLLEPDVPSAFSRVVFQTDVLLDAQSTDAAKASVEELIEHVKGLAKIHQDRHS